MLLTVLSLLFFGQCYKLDLDFDKVFGSGTIVEETRNCSSFRGIEIRGSIEIEFRKGSQQSVKLIGDDNILPLIRTEVDGDGILVIDPERSYRTNQPIRGIIEMTSVEDLKIVGSGLFKSDESFDTTRLNLVIEGSGSIRVKPRAEFILSRVLGSGHIVLSGYVDSHRIDIDGSASIESFGLDSADCIIELGGSGKCEVNVKHSLDVDIAGSGTVYYRGNPEIIHKHISGSGRLIRVD